MKRFLRYNIIAIEIAVVAILLLRFCGRKELVTETVVEHITDTLYFVDTITITRPEYVTKEVIRYVYIESDSDSVVLPIERKMYRDSVYELSVTGYNPELEYIKVYPKDKVIYNTVYQTNTIHDERWRLYVTCGVGCLDGAFSPNVGVFATTKGRFMYGAEIGVSGMNMIYGLKIGYKIR